MFAADTRPDLYTAIDRAADRLAVALARRLNRKRDLRRHSGARGVAALRSGVGNDESRQTET